MSRADRSRGSVTAETAVVLPVLVILLAASLWTLGLLAAQLGCVEAARAGARAAARGEPADQIRRRGVQAAGSGAVITVDVSGTTAVVQVQRRLAPPWPLLARLLPAVTLRADAVVDVEPGVAPP